MPSKSSAVVPKRRQAAAGRDGLTLGDRLRKAMADHSPPLTEATLLSACNTIAKDVVSQQLVNQILLNKNSRSAVVPILAEACGVRAVWLQFGMGAMRGEAPSGRGQMSHKDRADRAFMQAFRELPKDWEFMVRSIVETLAVAQRESHGEFARRAQAATAKLRRDDHAVHDE